jgi:hypothetical protein
MRCYGFDDVGRTVIEHEAEVIREFVARVLGGDSLTSIIGDMRRRKVPSAAGADWTQTSLRRLLQNPRLAGIPGERDRAAGRSVPAIISKADHAALVKILSDPARAPESLTNVRRYLLSGGLLRCGGLVEVDGVEQVCGKPLYTQPSNSGKRGYVCRAGAPSYGCGRIRIAAEGLEDEVRDRVLARLSTAKVRRQLEAAMRRIDVDKVKAELAELDERLAEAGREYATRRISMTTVRAVEAEVASQRAQMEEMLVQAERVANLPPATLESLAEWWVDAPMNRRWEVIQVVLDHVVVRKASRRGPTRLDPDRIDFVWR